eukprot:scaffold5892_cov112-Isochrysis_galbana.AAC.16
MASTGPSKTIHFRLSSVTPVSSVSGDDMWRMSTAAMPSVHSPHPHLVKVGVVLDARHCGLEDAEDARLAAASRADQHHAMAHHGHLVQLDALDEELGNELQLEIVLGRRLDLRLELWILGVGFLHAGKDVLDDGAEEEDVVA